MLSLKFAEEADIDWCLDTFEKLFQQSRYSRVTTFDASSLKTVLHTVINSKKEGTIILLICNGEPVGLIAGRQYNHLFNLQEKCGTEVAFYIQEGFRNYHSIRLLYGAFKHWAKLVGCSTIMMGKIKQHGTQEEYYMKRLR